MKIISSAPAKCILVGEHIIIYGYPALVVAVNLRNTIQLSLERDRWDQEYFIALIDQFQEIGVLGVWQKLASYIKQQGIGKLTLQTAIPKGVGMGSSASFASVLSQLCWWLAYKQVADKATINQLTYQLEIHSHGSPSGIDNYTIVEGGAFLFNRVKNKALNIQPVQLAHWQEFDSYLINTGKPVESTKEMIGHLSHSLSINNLMSAYLKDAGLLARKVINFLTDNKKNNLNLFFKNISLLNVALHHLQIASPQCLDLSERLRREGYFVKVSGAGGWIGSSGLLWLVTQKDHALPHWLKYSVTQVLPFEIDYRGSYLNIIS